MKATDVNKRFSMMLRGKVWTIAFVNFLFNDKIKELQETAQWSIIYGLNRV